MVLSNPYQNRYKGLYTFSKAINPKVNVMAWLGFELSYYDVTIMHINHYAKRILHL